MIKSKIKKGCYITSEKIFFILWSIYSTIYFLVSESELAYTYNIDISNIYRFVIYFTLLGQVYCLLMVQKWKVKKLVQYLSFLLLIFIIEVCVTEAYFLVYVFFIILAQNINFDKLLRYDIKIKIMMLLFILGMCLLGFFENYSLEINGTYKQGMGFCHPNVFTFFVMIILLEWMCIRYKKMMLYEWMLIIMIWYITVKIGGGRASGYTFLLIFCLYIVATVFPKVFFFKLSKVCFIIVTPFMAFISFYLVKLYNNGNKIAVLVNSVLTNRISLASNVLDTYGLKLFGQEIPYVSLRTANLEGIQSLIVDNAYINCALSYGIIYLGFITIMYSYLFYVLLKNKRIELALLSLFFVIFGMAETNMMNVLYNITFLYILGAENNIIIGQRKKGDELTKYAHFKRRNGEK